MAFSALLAEVDASSPAYQVGWWTAAILFPSIFLAGAIRALVILRKPGASPLCAGSLLLFFLSAFVVVLFSTIVLTAGLDRSAAWVRVIGSLVGFTGGTGVLLGLVLGIVGLFDYGFSRGKYRRGRGSGIWAVSLNLLVLLVAFSALAQQMVKNRPETETVTKSPNIRTPKVTAEGDEFTQLNFRFRKPVAGWTSLNPRLVNPDAAICLKKRFENTSFFIVAERGGVDLGMSSEDLAQVAKDNLSNLCSKFECTPLEERELAGIPFLFFETTGEQAAGNQYFCQHYVSHHRGYYYQLIVVSAESLGAVRTASGELVDGFSLLNPDDICYGSALAFTEPQHFPDLGFTAKLQGTGWSSWNTIATDFEEADFGALLGNRLGFGLVSFDLREFKLSDEELAAACLDKIWGNSFPEDTKSRRNFEEGGISGIEMDLVDESQEEPSLERIRVFQHAGRGWFVAVWTTMNEPAHLEEATSVFSRLEINQEHVPEADEKLSENQRDLRASLFNRLGIGAFQKEDYERAIALFAAAYDLDSTVTTFLTNTAEALGEQGKFEEAAEFLEKHRPAHAEDQDYVARIAWAWQLAGKDEKAIEIYEALFGNHYQDEDYLYEYLSLLADGEKRDEALAKAEAFVKEHGPSDSVLRWQANLLHQLDRTSEAVALLEKRRESGPNDRGLTYLLGQYYLDADQASRTLDICRELEEGQGEPAWDVCWLRGEAFMTLERYHDAKAAYEQALELDDQNETVRYSLSRASALLGEGDNTLIKGELEPVAIPAALLAEWEDGQEHSLPVDQYGQHILRKVTMYYFEPGQPIRSTE